MKAFVLVALLLAAAPPAEPDRSPSDVAVSSDGRWAVTANATSDTASLVDLDAGKRVAETQVGRRPQSVALSRDGALAVVTNFLSDSVTVLRMPSLEVVATIPVGDEPRGVALLPGRAFVALSGEDAVAVVDLKAMKVAARIDVGDEPWHVALTPDGKRLAVGNALSMNVNVIDAETLQPLFTTAMRGHNLRRIAVSPDGAWAYLPNIAERGFPTQLRTVERGWVIGARLSRVPLREEGPREAIALDPDRAAVGDLEGVAVRPDGLQLAVTVGGTGSVLRLGLPLPFVAFGGPGEHIDPDVQRDDLKYRRIKVGGRPLGVAYLPDGKRVVVANYLLNAVQIVDFEKAALERTIPLGGPAERSLARRGEAIFYDATRSWHDWFSCHTCHTDGHSNGGSYDTFNDGRYGNSKKVLSLRGVTKTGPWTWHGAQGNLRQSLQGSFVKTMAKDPATDEDLDAMAAFLGTIDFAPPVRRDPEAVRRGEAIFSSRGCVACHAPPHYTSPEAYLVGLEAKDDVYKGFNPPPLRGVATRGPFLHDGRARTLEEVLKVHHRPSKLSGKADLAPDELADLIEFLRSL